MKSTKIFSACITILFGLMILSCEKEENLSSRLKQGQIEYKATPNSNSEITFGIASQKLTIDWGDGDVEIFTPDGEYQEFYHTYYNRKPVTIKIETEKMTAFWGIDNDKYYDWESLKEKTDELRFGNCPNLKTIECSFMGLTFFEIEKADSLLALDCSTNNLTSLKLNACPKLKSLFCMFNNLHSIDIIQCKDLQLLWCLSNRLVQLDLQENKLLYTLVCGQNRISNLNIEQHKLLKYLVCDYSPTIYAGDDYYGLMSSAGDFSFRCLIYPNELRSSSATKDSLISISKIIEDTEKYPPLTHLNLSGCSSLSVVCCDNNQLTEINIQDCTSMEYMSCNYNELTDTALNSIFENLPNAANDVKINIKGNDGMYNCDKSIAENKGWKVISD
ncbi:MAG: hypothetical protein FWD60_08745 [Candidatus Azobacteroides sp.]|nr:hypothetical protein [Candidatus Azobacteroides sp.]